MKILTRESGSIGSACGLGSRAFFFRLRLLGGNNRGSNSGKPGQPFPAIAQDTIPPAPHQSENRNRGERQTEPGKKWSSAASLVGNPNNGFFRMAFRAGYLPTGNGRRHHLLKSALIAKKDCLVGVVCRPSRFFSHDNGMPAFRTRHGLAGMAVFNLYGISAFIAVKNHPASSTKPKISPSPGQPRVWQTTATTVIDRNEKILHIFVEITKKPQSQQEAKATGDGYSVIALCLHVADL